jgi:hypothetical protein
VHLFHRTGEDNPLILDLIELAREEARRTQLRLLPGDDGQAVPEAARGPA